MLSAANPIARFRLACLHSLAVLCITLPGVVLAGSGTTPDFRTRLFVASGVSDKQVAHWSEQLDGWGRELQNTPAGTESERAKTIHALIHQRLLTGKYLASASDLADALSGGPFNCTVTTALFLDLAAQCGLHAQAVSVPGHVWCRVATDAGPLNVETTCVDWFAILDRYRGLPDEQVSPAMALHRRRQALARVLDERQLLAIFYFNRGVTRWREQDFSAAAWANAQALCLDPACQVAWENLLASVRAAAKSPRYSGE